MNVIRNQKEIENILNIIYKLIQLFKINNKICLLYLMLFKSFTFPFYQSYV